MALWTAEVFVNSNVGRITTEVEAATPYGAKEQIYAKHGKVQQIVNLRQVSRNSSSSSDGDFSIEGIGTLIGIGFAIWLFMTFTPIVLMSIGGAAGAWISEKITGQTVSEYAERADDSGHWKFLTVLAITLILGGYGFVKGVELKKGFDAPSSPPAQIKSK